MKKAEIRKPSEKSGTGIQNAFIARAEVKIYALPGRVWEALVKPEIIRRYMFGTEVVSDWKEGSPITWKGEWGGKHYEDKGVILQLEPERVLRYSHFSPLSGLQDRPENYHTVSIGLSGEQQYTRVSLSQDNNLTAEDCDHFWKNGEVMLANLKKVVESDIIQGLFAEYEEASPRLISRKMQDFSPILLSQPARGAPLRRARPNF